VDRAPFDVELRHLRYFVAVAEELHFRRAAERLGIAQPPLSRQIRQLEQAVGAPLFVRGRHGITLTRAGRALEPVARGILADVRRAVSTARRAASEAPTSQLRLGYGWSATFEVLPALGRAFRARHPEIPLLAQPMWNSQLLAALLAGEIDLALTRYPEVAPQLAYATIRHEPLVVVVPRQHPLAGQPEVALAALAGERLIVFPRVLAPRFYDAILEICRRAGFEPHALDESFHTDWDLGLLSSADGVALAPATLAHTTPPGLALLPISAPAPSLDLTLCWRRDTGSAAAQAFITLAHEVAHSHGWLPAAAPAPEPGPPSAPVAADRRPL